VNEKNKMFTALFFIVCTIIPMFFATVNWYNTYGRGLESGEINPAAVLVVGLISLLMIAAAVFKLFPKIKDELFRLNVLKASMISFISCIIGIIIIISALSLNAVFNFIAALLILYFSIIAIFVLSFFYFEGN
jgi:amino acid transporter